MSSEHQSPEEFRKHVRVYIGIFIALLVLTALTVWASSWHFTLPAAAVTVALAIASVKGGLVAGFFMHLKGERPLVLATLILTAVFFLALILLPLMMLALTMTGNAG
ncbi:MAG: cytochrome C oxidase subunit IV family protein [Verrucomicrobia bacterium]|nr:cytochrome C oxidase subunit IV family protein [Verrucomicrobiota bacterium]